MALPAEILRFGSEADKGTRLGIVAAGGALVALVVMPLAGALSDRSTSRFGRRRPFIAAGALLNALALLAFGRAPTYALFVAAYWCVQFSNNLGGSAYSGFIPDLVPREQRGTASGFMGLMIMLGTVGGAIIAGILMERGLRMPLYLTIGGVLLATMLVTLWKVREEPLRHRIPLRLREVLAGFWIDPRRHPNFAWLFASRFLTLLGFYTILAFLQFFLKDFLRIERSIEAAGTLTGAVVAGALPSAFLAGWLSDRFGRRGIASASSILMGVLCLIFLAAPSFAFMLALGVVFGVGYGAFVSVEWALAADVLPSLALAATHLGVWGISATLPQVVGPAIHGPLLDAVNAAQANLGYFVIFALGALYLVVGGLLIPQDQGGPARG
ncbi:MAG: MFS transporter [Armatimonadota bacterium]